jgi:hypothetical protein
MYLDHSTPKQQSAILSQFITHPLSFSFRYNTCYRVILLTDCLVSQMIGSLIRVHNMELLHLPVDFILVSFASDPACV